MGRYFLGFWCLFLCKSENEFAFRKYFFANGQVFRSNHGVFDGMCIATLKGQLRKEKDYEPTKQTNALRYSNLLVD